MPPSKRPKSGKRRRKKKQDARKARIRNTLIGAALVMGTFITVGAIALNEMRLEEEERQRALLAAIQPKATARAETPPPKDAISEASDPSRPARAMKLEDLELGLPDSKVKSILGAPDLVMKDHRFRYTSLGLELKYRPVGGKLVLESISYSGGGVPAEAMGALNLPGVQIGGDPGVLRALAPQGRILYNRAARTYTLYLPERNLAVDFTPEAIQAVRVEQGLKARFSAAMSGPNAFEVSFEKAFTAQSMMGQRLTDAQFETTVKRVGNGNARAHTITLRLKVDEFNADDLREVIKRRVQSQIAGGDMAAAISVTAKNGSKIVDCDWYSPKYTELTGTQPQRFGAVDTTDNISYRWY